ncbi:MAG: hypothetical protein M1838_003215 [Thelocarpon superellum]|nr:MAG: hypothetical protein M1838_003215 [Thelocarpon superellum]
MPPSERSRSCHLTGTLPDDEETQQVDDPHSPAFSRLPPDRHCSGDAGNRMHTDDLKAEEGWDDELSQSCCWHRIPLPTQRVMGALVDWAMGPQPAWTHKIRPAFPRLQLALPRLVRRVFPTRRHRLLLLLAFYFGWVLAFRAVVHHSAFPGSTVAHQTPTPVGCGATYWRRDNLCGVDGNGCRPFADRSFMFRCPANCLKQRVLNPRSVGAQEIVYRPLVVGGPPDDRLGLVQNSVYRGDSFLCSAAIHAGVISNHAGGCAVAKLIGERDNYPSTLRNGIQSIAFDSSFPLSFTFAEGTAPGCEDRRWLLLAISLTFTILLSIFTTSPSVFFFSTYVGIYFHVGLASDPPSITSDYYSSLSLLLERFLPATFVAFVLYNYVVYRSLLHLTAQVEKTVLWLGGCWLGALTNYTFDFVPIQRLTAHDLAQQPGARAALAVILVILLSVAAGQLWSLRLEGRLLPTLGLYTLLGVGLALSAAMPGLKLRIHHYILALLLLPGTSLQTRRSLFYQGLLIGLFINGVARWGFASVLETPAALLGDGRKHTALPAMPAPELAPTNITFRWPDLFESFPPIPPDPARDRSANATYDGLSILVNDVERYVAYKGYHAPTFSWPRTLPDKPYYFRFGYLQGKVTADYTRAGVWTTNGSWIEPNMGLS